MNHINPRHGGPRRLGRSLSRSTRMILLGGLATGAGFAGATAIASASTAGIHNGGSTATSGGSSPGLAARRPGHGPMGGPGGPGGFGGPGGPMGGPGGPGGGGTITGIGGSTLTLRTENGTETVDTSSSTTYTKEMASIGFSALAVGDVVHVAGTPSSTTAAPTISAPPEPGTGTVHAARVSVVLPTFAGRVSSHAGGTYTIVGSNGRLLSVSTTAATRYYNGTGQTNSSGITDGTHVVAEGAQSDLTHLSADIIVVAPTPPAAGQRPPSPIRSGSSPVPSTGASSTGASSTSGISSS